MDFQWSAEEEVFRQEIREFLQAELPEGWGTTQFWDPDDDSQFAVAHAFTQKLGACNWLAVCATARSRCGGADSGRDRC